MLEPDEWGEGSQVAGDLRLLEIQGPELGEWGEGSQVAGDLRLVEIQVPECREVLEGCDVPHGLRLRQSDPGHAPVLTFDAIPAAGRPIALEAEALQRVEEDRLLASARHLKKLLLRPFDP